MINIACGSMVARRGKGVWRCDEPAMMVLKFQGKDKQIHEVHRCNQHGEALKRELQMNDLRTKDGQFKLIWAGPIPADD